MSTSAKYLALLVLCGFQGLLMVCNNEPWNLPPLPANPPDFNDYWNNSKGKMIPRHLWVAVKSVPRHEDLKEHQAALYATNGDLGWKVHYVDNEAKVAFMEKYYHNTSLLWAFNAINPKVFITAVDIWKYAVLWMIGGAYLDDDSYIDVPFDKIIGEQDSFVVAQEKNAYVDNCFTQTHHLAAGRMMADYNLTEEHPVGHIFGGRIITNWGIMSGQRHPIMQRIIENVVEALRQNYLRRPVVHMLRYDFKWKAVMCTTGPSMLTATLREMVLQNNASALHLKVCKRDFVEYGGVFKVWDLNDTNHYMSTMHHQHLMVLKEYLPMPPADMYEGKLITVDKKEIFLVLDGMRRGFKDFDTFQGLGFNLRNTHHITEAELKHIKSNRTVLTLHDYDWWMAYKETRVEHSPIY